jgi:phosphoglycerate dehydrogenase-like enzyme
MGNEKIRIAVLDDYQNVAKGCADWSLLSGRADVDFYSDHIAGESDLLARLKPYDVICAMRERTPFNQAILSKLDRLRLLVTTAMRNAAIDMEAARSLGVTVCGTDAIHSGTPELIWAHMLALSRQIVTEANAVKEGRWQESLGVDLHGKTLGIIGLGRVGSRVARIGAAFGMRVLAWSPNLTRARAREGMAEYRDKEALLASSDFIVLSLQLGDSTRGIIGARDFSSMKRNAYFINTSRAGLVDEDALVDALETRKFAGGGVDVFETEPLPCNHPLRACPNVLLTPHIGYVTRNTYQLFYQHTVENILAWLSGKPVRIIN